MVLLKNFTPRLYQSNILKGCIDKNCLVILPTGIGKTAIALLLVIERLNKFKNSKALLCSPTKPLCQQHQETFKAHTDIDKCLISLYTGLTQANKRAKIFSENKIIIATPQTIESDLLNNRINLNDFSVLIIDEAHRSRMKYANTMVAKKYIETAENPRILALTASPGNTKEKINEICSNLFIEEVEIRTDEDDDVKPYMQKKSIEFINIELENEIKKICDLLKIVYNDKLSYLKKIGFTKPTSLINKKDLLLLQKQFQKELSKRNPSAFFGISLTAQLLKLSHLIELTETQGLKPLKNFLDKLKTEQTKAAKIITNTKDILEVYKITQTLIKNKVLHPKLDKLKEIIKEQFLSNNSTKMIIFANYRDTIEELLENIKEIENCHPVKLIGHKKGITQKQQLETIKNFESGLYNCIITTSIGEEGLSIGTLDIAIFYDNVPSAIRKIQREGRVARTKPGKIIYLVAKNTRDSAYYWKSKRDEKTMKETITNIKTNFEKQQSLANFTKNESNNRL